MTKITDPFGAQIDHARDTAGRLIGVTSSPFGDVTSYVTDVDYRAWGAPKSISYRGSGSTIAYNTRMQPTQFRLTVNGTGASIIHENYDYFADGRLASLADLDDTVGSNPPVSLRFLSRIYSYDHVGRAKGGQGTGSAGAGVPYSQSYSYDEFGNMTGRTGAYYNWNFSLPASDTASYSNNRRTGWGYNADGQVIATPTSSTDSPRTMTYDAAGRLRSSVQTNEFNVVTYSATYNGDGQVVSESSNTSPGSFVASYIIRSTILGDVLTRLDQFGNKKITHVPAEGLLFATQTTVGGPSVLLTHRNPLGITENNKRVYDPLGNYIPFQAHGDPRPPAGSYSSASMSGLSSSQSDPHGYGVGCVMDGLPTSCDRVIRAINRGQAKEVILGGTQNPNVAAANVGFIPQVRKFSFPDPLDERNALLDVVDVIDSVALVPGGQRRSEQTPQNPTRRLTSAEGDQLRRDLQGMLAKPNCAAFLKGVLEALGKLPNGVYSTNLLDIFDAVRAQPNGGLFSDPGISPPASANAFGSLSSGDAQIAFREGPTAGVAAHEIMHVAAKIGIGYGHIRMAQAAHRSASAMGLTVLQKLPEEKAYKTWKAFDAASSAYFEQALFDACLRTTPWQPPPPPQKR